MSVRLPSASEVGSALPPLLPILARLDELLERAVHAAELAYGGGTLTDPFRGLHLGREDVERLLARPPGEPLLCALPDPREEDPTGTPLRRLRERFALSPFELDVIVLALAPEIDLRYERLYAYLHDDITRRRPTIDLALNLLCASASERLSCRLCFSPDAPLVSYRVIRVVPDPNHVEPTLLSHLLCLDEQIVRFLIGEDGQDSRLAPFTTVIEPQLPLQAVAPDPALADRLRATVLAAHRACRPLRLYFRGPPGAGRMATAEGLAREVGASLLIADLDRAPATKAAYAEAVGILLREAELRHAIPYLTGLDAAPTADLGFRRLWLQEAVASFPGVVIVAGTEPWKPARGLPLGTLTVEFPSPDAERRARLWRAALTDGGVSAADVDIETVAQRFRLWPAQIAEAAALCAASRDAAWEHEAIPTDTLLGAARLQCEHPLASLARKIEPRYAWADLILPVDAVAQLRDVCRRIVYREQVLGEWGFDRKLSIGKGVNVLFAGPSGTGKTMAAEVVARELALHLYRIDLAGVVSKYIGETEKNLDRIFDAAQSANAILFFDEADALFGKRSEVRDSHDRYANLEISYLLQKMEEYEGLAILATNLRQNLDQAFQRRLAATIHFPFPDEASRRAIWERVWPRETPLADGVDLDFLARQFKLSGGNIRNVALEAAFLGAANGGVVTFDYLLHAVQREFQKLGKPLSGEEVSGTFGRLEAARLSESQGSSAELRRAKGPDR